MINVIKICGIGIWTIFDAVFRYLPFFLAVLRYWVPPNVPLIIPSTQILARVFVYLSPFISRILDFICRMVLIFVLIYFQFEWRDTENQRYGFCLGIEISQNSIKA